LRDGIIRSPDIIIYGPELYAYAHSGSSVLVNITPTSDAQLARLTIARVEYTVAGV